MSLCRHFEVAPMTGVEMRTLLTLTYWGFLDQNIAASFCLQK